MTSPVDWLVAVLGAIVGGLVALGVIVFMEGRGRHGRHKR